MAHKTDGDCPLTVNAIIRKRAEMEKISINKMIELTAFETGIPKETIRDWVYPRKRSSVKNHTTDKPTKKHTKPEVKKQLADVAKEIESGNVSDDDIKKLDKATAKAISTGKAATRVGTATAAAIKKANKKKGGQKPKPIDNFKRLDSNLKTAVDGLTVWADGGMEPETKSEQEYAIAILAKGANLIIQYARLGADIQGIIDTFIQGDIKNAKDEYDKIRLING